MQDRARRVYAVGWLKRRGKVSEPGWRVSCSSHPGRLWVRRGLGPPSQGAAAVHTTPIAVPISVTIGEPDIPLWTPSAAWVIHNGPPKWRTVQENHRRPSSDSSRPGTQKLTGFRRAPAIENAVAVSISALYSSACGSPGEPSTAMSAIGSTKRHTAHARGSSPRRARSGPKMRSLGSKKDWAGGRNGRQCAAVTTRRSPTPSTTKPRPLPAVMTPAVSISILIVFCFNLDYLSLMLDNHFLAPGSHFVPAPNTYA